MQFLPIHLGCTLCFNGKCHHPHNQEQENHRIQSKETPPAWQSRLCAGAGSAEELGSGQGLLLGYSDWRAPPLFPVA